MSRSMHAQSIIRSVFAASVVSLSALVLVTGCDRTIVDASGNPINQGGSGGESTTVGGDPTVCNWNEVVEGAPCSYTGNSCGFGGTMCTQFAKCTNGVWHKEVDCIPQPKACPVPPSDQDIEGLLGQLCGPEGDTCASNNGCGGCTIRCIKGIWTQAGPELCYSVGPTC